VCVSFTLHSVTPNKFGEWSCQRILTCSASQLDQPGVGCICSYRHCTPPVAKGRGILRVFSRSNFSRVSVAFARLATTIKSKRNSDVPIPHPVITPNLQSLTGWMEDRHLPTSASRSPTHTPTHSTHSAHTPTHPPTSLAFARARRRASTLNTRPFDASMQPWAECSCGSSSRVFGKLRKGPAFRPSSRCRPTKQPAFHSPTRGLLDGRPLQRARATFREELCSAFAGPQLVACAGAQCAAVAGTRHSTLAGTGCESTGAHYPPAHHANGSRCRDSASGGRRGSHPKCDSIRHAPRSIVG